MFNPINIIVLLTMFSGYAGFSTVPQEHNQSGDADLNFSPKPEQTDSRTDEKAQLRIPKVGDTWKYKCFKNYGGASLKYVTFTVVDMVDIIPLIPSDRPNYYGCPVYETTHTFRDGTAHILNALTKILYSKSRSRENGIDVSEISGDSYDISTSELRLIYVLPLRLGFNCMNKLYDPLTGTITEMVEVDKYFDSVKVTAGTFYKVYQIHNSQRQGTSIETLSDEYALYAENIGMIKQARLIDGEIEPILELVSYKLKK